MNLTDRENGVILISGGLDSVTLLHSLMKYPETNIYPLFVDYGQKQLDKEIESVRYFCDKLKTNPIKEIKIEGHPVIKNDINYIPFRNMTLMSLGCAYCQELNGNSVYMALVGGTPTPGASGYLDSTPLYLEYSRNLVEAMTDDSESDNPKYKGIEIITPFFQSRSKADVYRLAKSLYVELDKIWSCCSSSDERCGKCNSCVEWEALKKIVS